EALPFWLRQAFRARYRRVVTKIRFHGGAFFRWPLPLRTAPNRIGLPPEGQRAGGGRDSLFPSAPLCARQPARGIGPIPVRDAARFRERATPNRRCRRGKRFGGSALRDQCLEARRC